jgi:hypothetical protein
MKKRITKEQQRVLEDYHAMLTMIQNSNSVDHTEPLKEQRIRKKRLLEDYNAFGKYYFSIWCASPAAPFHINFAEQLSERDTCFLVKMWSRGMAKSTTTWVSAIWLMLRGDFKFLVLASYNNDNATALLENIRAQLEANPRLKHDYGDFVRYGKWTAGNFQTKQGCIFRAIGRGQTPRGFNVNGQRPDLIIVDDIDDEESRKNPQRVQEGYDWMIGALMGTFDPAGKQRFVFVENLTSKTSILKLATENEAAEVEQINLLDDDGEPSWSARHDKKKCEEIIARMGYRLAQAEYFNNPIEEGEIYKDEFFRYKVALLLEQYDDLICYTDPSWKSAKKNDCKATVLVGRTGREYILLFIRVMPTTIPVMASWLYEVYKMVDDRANVGYYMESNFMQDRLLDDTQEVLDEGKIPLFVREDKRKKLNKLGRLEAMAAAFERGYFYISEALKTCPHWERAYHQFKALGVGSKVADDAPDAIEGAFWLLNERAKSTDNAVIISIKSLRSQRGSSKYRY